MKMINMVKYQLQIYFRESSFVMPFMASIIFLVIMYHVVPVEIVSSFLISGVVLFLIMTWVGLSTALRENDVSEQILYLRMHSPEKYYLGKSLSLICISVLASVLYTIFPVLQNALSHGDVFMTPLKGMDVLNAFLMLCTCAIAGGMMGNFFHPRVVKEKRFAIIFTLLFALLAVVKASLLSQFSILEYILWIIPSVTLFSEKFGNAVEFTLGTNLFCCLIMLIYALEYGVAKSFICDKISKW